MWNCCGSNVNSRCRSNYSRCGCTTSGTTTQNTNGLTNGTFGYFIPVNYTCNTTNCGNTCNSGGSTRVSCGNGVCVTVSCGGYNRGCAQNTNTAQTTQTGCNSCGNASTFVNDCYYARQYGLCSNTYSGCGF